MKLIILLALLPLALACDSTCLSRAAVAETNRYRATQGKGPLANGPPRMLKNALDHSTFQSSAGMQHQSLQAASQETCLFISRENVAYFWGYPTPPEIKLVEMWWNSASHRANMLGAKEGDYAVVGIVIDSQGRTFGTQTFSTKQTTC